MLAPTDHPLISALNPEQATAVLHDAGPLLVLAGAGSGKTRVITHRIAWLVHERGVRPWNILAVTFSNKAAGEMRHRVGELLGGAADELWLGTFHSIGSRLLRSIAEHAGIARSFSIYDRDDQLRMIGRVMKAAGVNDRQFKPRTVQSYIDRAKNNCWLPGDAALPKDGPQQRMCAQLYGRYEEQMRLADAVDFGDLLMRPVQVFAEQPALRQHWAKRFRYILVDEFQDTNDAQYRLLGQLGSVHGNLAVVGDDDQSIYAWRGARIANILGFPERHAGCVTVRLERNYRSTQIILDAAGAVVRRNAGRHEKTLWTDRKEGAKVWLREAATDRDEADWIARRVEALRAEVPLREVAVFYRTNAQSRVLEEAMARFRLPAIVIGGQRFYDRAEVKDLLAYCRLVVNPRDSASWLRVVNTPRRGIGKRTIELVEERARARAISLPEASRELMLADPSSRVGRGLAGFEDLLEELRGRAKELPADRAGTEILERSGLRHALVKENTIEAEGRLENLGELLSAMSDYADEAPEPGLTGFLEQIALVTDTDKLDRRADAVSLMTMHAAKGLEYDATFVAGLEDGLVPHANSVGHTGVEEERRLLYVAMTRARKRLHLSWARMRRRFGVDQYNLRSPFVADVPDELLERGAGGFRRRGRLAPATLGAGRPSRGAGLVGRRGRTRRGRSGGGPGRAVARARSDETVIEREPATTLEIGAAVRHGSFGRGEVIDVAGYGSRARVTVRFASVGIKKVVARFLAVV